MQGGNSFAVSPQEGACELRVLDFDASIMHERRTDLVISQIPLSFPETLRGACRRD